MEENNRISETERKKRIAELEDFFDLSSEEFVRKVLAQEELPHRLEDETAYWLMLLGRGDVIDKIMSRATLKTNSTNF